MIPYIVLVIMIAMPIILCWVFDLAEEWFYPIDREE